MRDLCLLFDLNSIFFSVNLLQIIDDDNGMHMRPMPGMFDVKSSGSTVLKTLSFFFPFKVEYFETGLVFAACA